MMHPKVLFTSARRYSKMCSAPAQAANATTINPGITRREKERPPLVPAKNILLIVFVENPARIGKTASVALISPDPTSEATEMAAECVSTNPETTAAKTMPVSPSHCRSLAARRTAGSCGSPRSPLRRWLLWSFRPWGVSCSALGRCTRCCVRRLVFLQTWRPRELCHCAHTATVALS